MFRRLTLIVAVLGLTLSVAVTPAAAKTETFHSSFQGQFVEAFMGSRDATGCIETDVYVTAEEGRVKVNGGPETHSIATIAITQYNSCTNDLLLDAQGFATLAPDEFVIDKQLNQATLTTTIVVEDFVTSTTFPIDVNLTWTGVGETIIEKEHFQIKEPGLKVIFRFMGTFRQAQASGTVMGINFTPESTFNAVMGDAKTGEVDIVQDF